MTLLSEYALTPDVFDSTSYSVEELGDVHLRHIMETLLSQALVRNLRDGEWLNLFKSDRRSWHQRGKELLKKLVMQRRLRVYRACLENTPTSDQDWCSEALESHKSFPLTGVVVTGEIAHNFPGNALVAPIHSLGSRPWWKEARRPSVRLRRTKADYELHLGLILQCANSLMFIDPHLDPREKRYKDFVSLLGTMAERTPCPRIEIHRVCYVGSGPHRQKISEHEWEDCFHNAMSDTLKKSKLSVEVFIWDHFHDRYLISNLIGIHMSNGFDTTTDPTLTTWSRLDREDRDNLQKEFDPASSNRQLIHSFEIGQDHPRGRGLSYYHCEAARGAIS